MKKTLSLLCAACIAVGMQAQTYMVNDFESGLNGANAAWGGTAELIDNPCSSSDNSSTKSVESSQYRICQCGYSIELAGRKDIGRLYRCSFTTCCVGRVGKYHMGW